MTSLQEFHTCEVCSASQRKPSTYLRCVMSHQILRARQHKLAEVACYSYRLEREALIGCFIPSYIGWRSTTISVLELTKHAKVGKRGREERGDRVVTAMEHPTSKPNQTQKWMRGGGRRGQSCYTYRPGFKFDGITTWSTITPSIHSPEHFPIKSVWSAEPGVVSHPSSPRHGGSNWRHNMP